MRGKPFAAIVRRNTVTVATCLAVLASVDAHAGLVDGLLGTLTSSLFGQNWTSPENYHTCILERMPGAENDEVASQISDECLKKFPMNTTTQQQKGLLHEFNSGSECYISKSSKTTSQVAQQTIQFSCFTLYGTGYSH